MTPIELLTERWFCIQEARLKELQEVTRHNNPALFTQVQNDTFWDVVFEDLEQSIRDLDPDHSLLTENQIHF